MKVLFTFFLISSVFIQLRSQSHSVDSVPFPRIDTICNYLVSRDEQYLTLPENFDFKNNQRGFVLLELTIESERVKVWQIDLFRIYENDSIIRNYTVFSDEKTPSDIESLRPIIENIIKKIGIKSTINGSIDPLCKIGILFKLRKIKMPAPNSVYNQLLVIKLRA